MRLTLMFRKRWMLLYLPVLLLSGISLWLAATLWMPLPPTSFVMAGGPSSSGYAATALRYRDRLEARGIRTDIVSTDESTTALARLLGAKNQGSNDIQAALAQGLQAQPSMQAIVAIAAIERQPVWIFTRMPGIVQLSQLKGLRIASADLRTPAGAVTQFLLQHAQLKPSDVTLLTRSPAQAATDLLDGRVDVAILVASGTADSVRLLTRNLAIQVLGIDRVAALTAREPRLKAFALPQGAIELRGDIPPRDLTMLATHLHLLVRSTMHPALQRALLDTSRDIHELPSFLQRVGEFPSTRDVDFAASPVALATAQGDRPWMELLLPYWWAQLVELLLFAVLPIMLLTLLALRWIPHFFDWKVNAALQNFYGELKFLETDIEPVASSRPIEMKKLLQRLDDIEAKVSLLDLPDRYANRWYTLREHIARARDKLIGLRAR